MEWKSTSDLFIARRTHIKCVVLQTRNCRAQLQNSNFCDNAAADADDMINDGLYWMHIKARQNNNQKKREKKTLAFDLIDSFPNLRLLFDLGTPSYLHNAFDYFFLHFLLCPGVWTRQRKIKCTLLFPLREFCFFFHLFVSFDTQKTLARASPFESMISCVAMTRNSIYVHRLTGL